MRGSAIPANKKATTMIIFGGFILMGVQPVCLYHRHHLP
jgi:hypothetical protein